MPTPSEVRKVLEAHRALPLSALRTAGLEGCRIEADFVPRIRCGEPSPERDEALDALWIALERRDAADSADALHAKALLHLAAASEDTELDSDTIQEILADLDEVLAATEDPARRSRVLTDLASAHLLLAEANQGALEIGAALEAALEALETAPDDPEARYVRRYAELLLGLIHGEDVADDPVLAEIATRLLESPATVPTPPCLSQGDFFTDLDTWARAPSVEGWKNLTSYQDCAERLEDRLINALLYEGNRDPEKLAENWRSYRLLERSALDFDRDPMHRYLEALTTAETSAPIRRMAEYFRALELFQVGRHDEATAMTETLRAGFEDQGFLGLQLKCLILSIQIANSQRDVRRVPRLQAQAEALSHRLGIVALSSKVESQRGELDTLGGREYDAWRAQALALRRLDADALAEQRLAAFAALADLARGRHFEGLALGLQDHAVAISEGLGTGVWISMLRTRGTMRTLLGWHDHGRQDLDRARQLLAASTESLIHQQKLAADLDYLEALATEDPTLRRSKLGKTLVHDLETGSGYRIIEVRHQLALAEIQLGSPGLALETLGQALEELTLQVSRVPSWREATALMAAARPAVDTLVGLQLEHQNSTEVLATIGRYLGLRTQDGDGETVAPINSPRLTTFVRENEVLLLFEDPDDDLVLERSPVDRETLRRLRQRVLTLTHAPERFETTLESLAEELLAPFADRLLRDDAFVDRWDAPTLVVVADDVLAGVPFHLLPIDQSHDGAERLLDRWAVVYSTDLRAPGPEPVPGLVLSIGASGAGSELGELPEAEGEAHAVAQVHMGGPALVGNHATPEQVLGRLEPDETEHFASTVDSLHLASHFEANTRRPLESTIVLTAAEGPQPARLTLARLLDAAGGQLDLLYLSACDTGRGLPTEAHGIHSLAQAFPASGIARTVLTLWPLEDALAADIAKRFHQGVAQGVPAARALRTAQLEYRDQIPASWGALVVVQ